MQTTFRKRFLAIVATLFALILTPALLFAHAELVRSSPAANSRLDVSPAKLQLWFSERPELKMTTLELTDSASVPMALGSITALTGTNPGLSADVLGQLANGKYTVTWHTAASDGHASSGKFSFVLAAAKSATGPEPMPEPTIEIHPALRTNLTIAPPGNVMVTTGTRWAELVSLLTLIGAVVFRMFILSDAALPAPVAADSADRTRRIALAALILFFVATFTRLVAESRLMPSSVGDRVGAVMSVVRNTSWGHGWLIGLVGALLMLAGLTAGRGAFIGWVIAGLGVAAIATSEALTGHPGASTHRMALAVAIDVAHVLGAGGWLGGLVAVTLAGLPAINQLKDAQRPTAGSKLVRAYHRAATDSVTVVIVTALVAAWLRLGTISELWTSAYGHMLLRKIFFVLVLLGFGLYHWRTSVIPEWDADSKFRFQRSVTIELLIGGVVVVFTALLIGMSFPTH